MARTAGTRANCRGLPAAAAPSGPEDALAEAQPRRPSDGRTLGSRCIPATSLQPRAGPTACREGDRPPEGHRSSHPTRTHHAAPRSPSVYVPTARRPTRAVQSGLRVTKSRARLQPDPDRRADLGTHRPSGVRTKFQSSLPCEGRGLRQRRCPWPCPMGSKRSWDPTPPVPGSRHSLLQAPRCVALAGVEDREPRKMVGTGERQYTSSLQPQPGGTLAPRSGKGTGLDWTTPA